MTKEVLLHGGRVALVDDEDYERVSAHKWRLHCRGYAITQTSRKQGHKVVLLHRLVMNPPAGLQVDHINRNKLDNRKSNLRVCTAAENLRNTGLRRANTSGYRGVSYTDRNKWAAFISHQGKTIYLGRYNEKADAARAYEKKARELFGEFVGQLHHENALADGSPWRQLVARVGRGER